MHLSSVLRAVVRGSDGQSIWREASDLRLPVGGKRLSFKQNSLVAFTVFLGFVGYSYVQEEINPDSKWAGD
ncbi:unnamed protein product [Nippostrongylus brasiliensis]|uniref:Succinate dehydrogenase assembly factor 4, mitochondrial n=1 Tax=Nippostrongylus brasiliensis TaxID=27835 RepID=A0A0N4XYB5_NIPBR|nr:unnamed protein product [Nippostrongylus brasiliensis]